MQKPQPDPTGRVDIAFSRLLEFAVGLYATPQLKTIYGAMQPQINMGIAAVVGPRTLVGDTARQTVKVIHTIADHLASSTRGAA
jgi:hypothetical protein